jgi:hypothetical protein
MAAPALQPVYSPHPMTRGRIVRPVVLVLLLCAAAPACAGWEAVDQAATGTTYADRATIVRNGDAARMWWMFDHVRFQRMVEVGYFSRRSHTEFDCTEPRSRLLEVSLREQHMGEGSAIYTDDTAHDWEAVEPGSVADKLRRVACGQ